MMPRFVLKRRTLATGSDIDQVGALDGVRVIDRIDDKALLIEADEATMNRHIAALADWTVAPEVTYPPPSEPRSKIRS